jgi:hypothetical protein
MMILKLVECSDWDEDYGVLVVRNKNVTRDDIQNKIYKFKNSYKAYGYSSLEAMRKDGYETVDDLICNEIPEWDVDQLVEEAFPKSWKVSRYEFDGTVEC